jgi:DNA-directed RNA polymerase alpha subunit
MGIDTVAKLMAHTPEELIGAPNFGENSLKEVRATLKRVGGRLRNDFDAE